MKTCAKKWTTRGPGSGFIRSRLPNHHPPNPRRQKGKRHVFLSICDTQPPLEPPKRQPTINQPKAVKWTATNKKQLQALSQTRPDWPPQLMLRCAMRRWSPSKLENRGADCRGGGMGIPITTRGALSRCTLVVCPSSLPPASPGGVSVFEPWLPLTRCRPAIGLGTCRHPVSAAIVVTLDCSCQD